MTNSNDTIRALTPLKVRKKNDRPKLLPPTDNLPREDQTQVIKDRFRANGQSPRVG